ncbi:MAG: DUF177 domain-containing protein [Clostridia bacterium]
MLVDLRELFSGEIKKKDINYSFSLADVETEGVKPFVSPIEVDAVLTSSTGSIKMDGKLSFDYKMPCDRCMEDTLTKQCIDINYFLTKENCEDLDDIYLQVEDKFDLDDFFYQEIFLNLPVKYVCKDNCKGLCPICGANLNKEDCSCEKKKIDPRLEALKLLLQDE